MMENNKDEKNERVKWEIPGSLFYRCPGQQRK
jgi:hypothetical protein